MPINAVYDHRHRSGFVLWAMFWFSFQKENGNVECGFRSSGAQSLLNHCFKILLNGKDKALEFFIQWFYDTVLISSKVIISYFT